MKRKRKTAHEFIHLGNNDDDLYSVDDFYLSSLYEVVEKSHLSFRQGPIQETGDELETCPLRK
ncbi:hypothetical protein ES703_114504 [subsurface metagenome]